MKCVYCGINATGSDTTDITQHKSCHDEWNRRVDEKLCVNCGKPPEPAYIDSGSHHREQCPLAGFFPGCPYSQTTV